MSTSPNRMVGIIFGTIYLVIGIFGFFITSATGFTSTQGPLLIGLFELNNLHNLVHLVIGVVLLIAGLADARVAKVANSGIGAVFLVIAIVGLFVAGGNNPVNILALNAADVVLYFASAVILLAIGIGAERVVRAPKAAA
jgi:Domain of unknown function (DUF4383)